ncbi:GNAT family N-acetyltransferase [Chitinophaga vietnamensis]|uniref:GNAT family N-acetyltransferase n=1 Tax=Chitinophaga vietnamensis TaxID=2593957 RepID=UPI001177D40F|nr:GNAT family N-acetyltransferase [Chitinophaga vietnamensis]
MHILHYRLATAADAAAIADLSVRSYEEFAAVMTPGNWERMRTSQGDMDILAALMKMSYTFVCESGAKLVGVVFLVRSGNPTVIYPEDWAYIRRLGVDPDFRGLGIGQQLMEMAIRQAREDGEKILGLHTSTAMPAARKMYDKLGFELVKELEPIIGLQYWLYRMTL